MSFLNRFLEDAPQDDLLDSVVRNLSQLLNSKRGYGSPLCDFGLGEYYAQQGALGAAEALMREMASDVKSYEPRLRLLSLRLLSDGELPHFFELRGQLQVDSARASASPGSIQPCCLGILFDPIYGEIAVQILEGADVR